MIQIPAPSVLEQKNYNIY